MRSADDLGDSLGDLAAGLRDFARARDWERFHTPKNLAMALAGEAGELVACFQWLTPDLGSAARRQHGPRIWPLKCGDDSDPGTRLVYLDTGVTAGQHVAARSPVSWHYCGQIDAYRYISHAGSGSLAAMSNSCLRAVSSRLSR